MIFSVSDKIVHAQFIWYLAPVDQYNLLSKTKNRMAFYSIWDLKFAMNITSTQHMKQNGSISLIAFAYRLWNVFYEIKKKKITFGTLLDFEI